MTEAAASFSNRVICGALAGVVATAPMTAAMHRMHRRLDRETRYPLPPPPRDRRIGRSCTCTGTGSECDVDRPFCLRRTVRRGLIVGDPKTDNWSRHRRRSNDLVRQLSGLDSCFRDSKARYPPSREPEYADEHCSPCLGRGLRSYTARSNKKRLSFRRWINA